MQGHREDWFPTSIWHFDHPDPASLNADLLGVIRAERQRDPAGMSGRSSSLGWHSRDDLHTRPEFRSLAEFATAAIDEVVSFLKWDRAKLTPFVSGMWAIVNGPRAANVVHTHPHSFLSGVYYVAAPEKCGRIFFQDPRPAATFAAPVYESYTPWTFQQVRYEPRAGRLVLFPAWVPHGVDPNLSDSERVVVSFNVGGRWA